MKNRKTDKDFRRRSSAITEGFCDLKLSKLNYFQNQQLFKVL